MAHKSVGPTGHHKTNQKPLPLDLGPVPACFNSQDEWENWTRMALSSNDEPALALHGHCLDCTREYQTLMRDEDRCAHPHVTFVPDKDGLMVGRRFNPVIETVLL